MKLFEYIIFGIIQGLTEPLPISSSGHLVLLKNIFNTTIQNDLNFEIVVNFGSFLAILLIFWKDIIKLIHSFFGFIFTKNKEKKKEYQIDFKYCLLIIIGSIPVGITGLLLKDKIETILSGPRILGVAFLITALALFLVRNSKGIKKDKDITYKDAIIIGLLQMVALFPGISRSGTVLVGCLLCGLSRETSLKYTFMLYFPVSDNITSLVLPYTAGLIASGIVTYFAYRWLSNWVKKGQLWKFSIYCLTLGIFVLFFFR